MFLTTRKATIDRLADVLTGRIGFYRRMSRNIHRAGLARADLVVMFKQDMNDFVRQNIGPRGVQPLYRVRPDPDVHVEFIGETDPRKIVKRLVYGD